MNRYLIVDDEPLAHELIQNFCGLLPHLRLAKNCYDALEAMEYLSQHQVELMFLDLNMPKLKGFEFLRTLAHPPKVIVTTAYREYALEGYELNISDYLLKPFSFERFAKAVNKALAKASPEEPAPSMPQGEAPAAKPPFFVKGDKKHFQVLPEKVVLVEAQGNYSKIVLTDGVLHCHEKISDIEGWLGGPPFWRVHKSFIVQLGKVDSIEGNRLWLGKYEVPIGQTYRKEVVEWLMRP